ncbi:hypothetical protein WJX75_003033 [Coccomyxa subellipsoidea]|uniref:Uncharacterized protein n=1 Tax=Coccomyxa subellipsoidea TaxID=248742 RepID=A0ABR2YCU9_9CHLO
MVPRAAAWTTLSWAQVFRITDNDRLLLLHDYFRFNFATSFLCSSVQVSPRAQEVGSCTCRSQGSVPGTATSAT